MYPVLFQICNFEIRSHGMILGVSPLLTVWLTRKETAGASNTAMEAVNLMPGWKEGVS
jgi:hypothetical protein